jgi:hypothetical protein
MPYTPDPSMAAVEQVIRDLFDENPDLPMRAEFHRGANPNRYAHAFAPATLTETVATPAFPGEWFVMVKPTSFDIIVSAAGRYEFGAYDVIGDPIEVRLPRVKGRPDKVDAGALTGSPLHVELLTAIREKAAVVEQMRAAVGS